MFLLRHLVSLETHIHIRQFNLYSIYNSQSQRESSPWFRSLYSSWLGLSSVPMFHRLTTNLRESGSAEADSSRRIRIHNSTLFIADYCSLQSSSLKRVIFLWVFACESMLTLEGNTLIEISVTILDYKWLEMNALHLRDNWTPTLRFHTAKWIYVNTAAKTWQRYPR